MIYLQPNNCVINDGSSDTVDVDVTDDADESIDFTSYATGETIPKAKKTKRKQELKEVNIVIKEDNDNDNEEENIYVDDNDDAVGSSSITNSAREVLERFAKGCECQGTCFADLNPENVYRHRLNIAELTKEEHDMYLMGVCMASLANPKETSRHKERIRQRASYVYHGKRVCLDAFLYLENVTHYQLKRIRSHVMTNGVVPRVHGNVRKKPHNTFSLDMYIEAENFLKETLTQYTNDVTKHCFIVNESRTSIYEKFKQNIPSGGKIMGYSTFRHFLQKQFPNVRFVNRQSDTSAVKTANIKDYLNRRQQNMKKINKNSMKSSTNRQLKSQSSASVSVKEITVDDIKANAINPTDSDEILEEIEFIDNYEEIPNDG